MKPIRSKLITAAIGAALLGGSAATFAANAPLPAEQHQGSVAYISGGVGKDEAAAFKKAAASYPLMLEFVAKTKPRNEFLSDIQVAIKEPNGKEVLNTKAEGPFLLAKLPAGTYKVYATHNGQTREHTVKIGKSDHHRVVFEWNA